MCRRLRGFTLIEVVVVVAIIAIGAAVTVPTLSRMTERAERRAVVRDAVSHLRFVRMTAMAHGAGGGAASFTSVPGIVVPVVVVPSSPSSLSSLMSAPSSMFVGPPTYTALRVLSSSSYQLVARRNGSDQTLGVVVVNENVPTMRIASPLPLQEIRFSSRGYRDSNSAGALVLQDAATGQTFSVDVSLAGLASIK